MSENEKPDIEETDPEVVAHTADTDDELAAPGWCVGNSSA